MNGVSRAKRNGKIEALFLRGLRPANIAEQVRLKVRRVRTILKDMGHDVSDDHDIHAMSHSIWDLEPGRRRMAIHKRAANAAREALKG